ncbi:hypothetical protein D9615_004634 [Tricholomella constricta]|uniref:DNA polymerase kappa n=1 Tax=Tricholomella constricta TaxID=117010 RepID=A0A8H5HC99_9AGAR|nr:hypothetical protein D9615_004634 [Tricholomella constricta]
MANHHVNPVASQDTETLVKRLAGPSTGKAGLAKDQTETNRIIAEASKGSKFYENEKKKDKDLTGRIEKILKQRDDVLRGVDIKTVEQSADRLIAELESYRDLSQIIVHVDMDAFYANVELLDNSDLEGKPFGVGHGVLTTASYEARKYGVRSGMPGFIAKKLCADLVFVKNHFSRYMEMSKVVMSVFKRYDPNLLAAGCDEAYLNITTYCESHGLTAAECVQEMRRIAFQETKLSASAGIAPTKMLAKICSDKNKPNGQFELPSNKESILSFLHDLSIRKIPGIGRVNERLLESIGIQTCGDIFIHRATIFLMEKQFGRQYLFRTYLGITSNVVEPMARGGRKSIGAERTFSSLSDKGKIFNKLDEIAVELEKDMEENGWAGRTVTLKFKLDTYQVFTRAKSFDRWISRKEDLYTTGKELILPEFPLTIRLIGLRVTKLKDLRAPSEPTNGIKRFFEPLQSGQPRKKAKLEQGETDMNFIGYDTALDDDLEDVMPGFHENDENDHHLDQEIVETLVPETNLIARQCATIPRPPAPTPSIHSSLMKVDAKQHLASSSISGPSSSRTIKPHSLSDTARPTMSPAGDPGQILKTGVETHACPICGKTLRTDNQGINSHIDFCLSRGAIREARDEARTAKKATFSGFKLTDKGKEKGRK